MSYLRAGDLRHYITLQKRDPQAKDPETGQPLPPDHPNAWVTVTSFWGEWVDLRGSQFFEAAAAQSQVTGRIKTRYMEGVRAGMRVVEGGRVAEVVAPVRPERSRSELHIMVKDLNQLS